MIIDVWCSLQQSEQILYCSFFSYKSCLPKSHRHDIQKRNRLDRYRIRNSLKHFLKKFGNCSVDECSLKLMYLIELAGIEPSLGSETFEVNCSSSHLKSTVSLVRVTGGTGIQTSGSCHPDDALVRTNSRALWFLWCRKRGITEFDNKSRINCKRQNIAENVDAEKKKNQDFAYHCNCFVHST